MKIARGRPSSTASSQAYSVCTSTPSTADTTTITASAARIALRRSPTKSAVPGASSTLIFVPLHSTGDIASDTETPRRCSSGSWSDTVFPSSIVPMRVIDPAVNSMASSSEVFPAPAWPTSKTLRMSFAP